ncbi:MAG: glycosyl hydrolase 115 family protein [Lachnoclostridium sp.]|jgi:hypothetical protein|nr:glycosyl hydrolase 115 family protein [Lachnoclostridium sp.]
MKKSTSSICGKRIWAFILAVSMFVASISVTPFSAEAAGKKKVKSINVMKPKISKLTMKKGSKFRLKVNVLPKNASNKKLTFQSNKSSIVSVTKKGVLTAKKQGLATITVKSANGKKQKISVTVVPSLKKAKKITLNLKNSVLYIGGNAGKKTVKLSAKVSPNNATVKKVVYESSDRSVAAVNKNGTVTAKKVGKVNITAYAADGWGKKAVCKIEVKAEPILPKPTVQAPVSSVPATSTPTVSAPSTDVPSEEPSDSAPVTGTPVASDSVPTSSDPDTFVVATEKKAAQIYLDNQGEDYEGLKLIANSFASDVDLVADATPKIITEQAEIAGEPIIAGSIGNNALIDQMISEKKLDVSDIEGKSEIYQTAVVENPIDGVAKALVIVGSDKRGTIYGIFHISEMMGVSPWVYWADVMPEEKETVSFSTDELSSTSKEPSVKYRGIFLNDEEPSLGTWVQKFKKNTGQKFNEYFYDHVFQLILRLKGNYLWPAMWGSAFSTEGADTPIASAKLADTYGVIMGTSHHEPMMRAHKEWTSGKSNYGGEWNYSTNKEGLQKFFEEGAVRNGKYENVITLGMRGDGDAPMLPTGSTLKENIDLLKEIITDQKAILKDNNLENEPTILALYKEVEDYWHGDSTTPGLKEWDGVDGSIALLSEDNYGNLRTLPTEENKNRDGGWGMYYHFDYNGAPTSYQWLQTIQLEKIWEQMSMAYDYGVKDMWIVNVGDLKPMESAISYFMDMAWDFERWGSDNVNSTEEYMEKWVQEQFGVYTDDNGIQDIQSIISGYLKLNTGRRPENVFGTTYSIENYNEAMSQLDQIEKLIKLAQEYKEKLPEEAQAAYYQLAYYPAVASANVHRLQIYSGLNKAYVTQGRAVANVYALLLERAINFDKQLEETYNKNMPGGVGDKWDGMMAQARNALHVGYPGWEPRGAYPIPEYLEISQSPVMMVGVQEDPKVYRSGDINLQEFTSINNENYYVDIANGGGTPFDYTVTASDDWIRLTKSSGTVSTQDTIGISVDFTKINEDSTGSIVIEGNDQEVTIHVSAKVIDSSGLDPMTFVEAHNYISIEAAHYANSVEGEADAKWLEIKNYGRTLSSIKSFPTTSTYTDMTKAPYVEYKIKTAKKGLYAMQTYFAPSNNVDRDNVTMKFGFSVDDGNILMSDTISPTYIAGTWRDSLWSNGVRNGVHTKQVSVGNLEEGEHTIRIYAVDPAIVLQKLVLFPASNELKTSYFGPQESYYVGKTTDSKLTADIPEQMNVASCTIPGSEDNNYEIIIPKEASYEVSVEAEYEEEAVYDVMWNDKKAGQLVINQESEQEGVFAMPELVKAVQGRGVLSLKPVSGEATIKNVSVIRIDTSVGQPIYVRASSEEDKYFATNAYSTNPRLYWKPLSTDEEPYLEFDNEKVLYIDRIAITEKGNNVNAYEIRVLNGSTWTTVYQGDAINSGSVIFLHGKTEIRGEKIRIVFTDIKEAPSISQVSFTPYINWAREDGSVTLSGLNTATGADLALPATVIDGNRITKALEASLGGSSEPNPYSYTMEFSEPRMIDTVNVISLQEAEATAAGTGTAPDTNMKTTRAQATYAVSYFDGENWIPMGAVKNIPEPERKVFNTIAIDDPVEATKIKIDVYTSHWVRFVELEAIQSLESTVVENYAKSKLASKEDNEIILTEPCEISKINLQTTATEGTYTLEYAQKAEDLYAEIPSANYVIQPTADGLSITFLEAIGASKVRITPPAGAEIEQIELWGSLPEQLPGSVEEEFYQGFETNTAGADKWGNATTIAAVTDEKYEGNKSLYVSKRENDWDAAAFNIASLGVDNTVEYTFSCYVKSKSGAMNMQIKICNENGEDQAEATGSSVAANSDGWTYLEYKFRVLNANYQTLKIQTVSNKEDYYIDEVKITKPVPPCTCYLSAPYITNSSHISIPAAASDETITLQAEAEKGICEVEGHAEAEIVYTYAIFDDKSGGAAINGDELKVSKPGIVIVKVTAAVNDLERTSLKAFEVTQQ